MWCHPSVWKTWPTNLSGYGNTMFLAMFLTPFWWKLKNNYMDYKMSPQPPSTSEWVVNGWHFNLGGTPPLTRTCGGCQCVWKRWHSQIIYSAEGHGSVHLFAPQMLRGIQIAIKTRALERCREMDLHPNSSRGLALTLLRIGSESISWKPSLLNCKSEQLNG